MKKFLAILLSGAFILSLTACETTKGVGRDLQNAGEKMEKAIDG